MNFSSPIVRIAILVIVIISLVSVEIIFGYESIEFVGIIILFIMPISVFFVLVTEVLSKKTVKQKNNKEFILKASKRRSANKELALWFAVFILSMFSQILGAVGVAIMVIRFIVNKINIKKTSTPNINKV